MTHAVGYILVEYGAFDGYTVVAHVGMFIVDADGAYFSRRIHCFTRLELTGEINGCTITGYGALWAVGDEGSDLVHLMGFGRLFDFL